MVAVAAVPEASSEKDVAATITDKPTRALMRCPRLDRDPPMR